MNNLINDPKYQGIIEEYRQKLRDQMEKTQDPALEAFDNRYDKDKVREWLKEDAQKVALAEKNISVNNNWKKNTK